MTTGIFMASNCFPILHTSIAEEVTVEIQTLICMSIGILL
jgi:hypothetical protein